MTVKIAKSQPQPIFPIFQEYGLEAMIQAYNSNMSFFSYRWKQYVWQALTGLRFIYFLKHINLGIKDLSSTTLTQASWNVLHRLKYSFTVNWQCNKHAIQDCPVIFYARHPSYFEPMLCLAALKDFNPQTIATSWVVNLGQSITPYIIPIPDAKAATSMQLRKYQGLRRLFETIWAHILTFQVIKYLQGDLPLPEYEHQRRSAITSIISTLGEKRSILLFPAGGEGQKPWVKEHLDYFKKLLAIIQKRRTKIPSLQKLLFVPLITKGSLRAFFKSDIMMPANPIAFLFRLLPDQPYQITIKEQIPLEPLLQSYMDPLDIARYLTRKLVAPVE